MDIFHDILCSGNTEGGNTGLGREAEMTAVVWLIHQFLTLDIFDDTCSGNREMWCWAGKLRYIGGGLY